MSKVLTFTSTSPKIGLQCQQCTLDTLANYIVDNVDIFNNVDTVDMVNTDIVDTIYNADIVDIDHTIA